MAVIRHRGDFQYQAIVRRRGYEEQTLTFTTQKEAQSWAINVGSEMVCGVFVSRLEAERTMLCEVIERYVVQHGQGGAAVLGHFGLAIMLPERRLACRVCSAFTASPCGQAECFAALSCHITAT